MDVTTIIGNMVGGVIRTLLNQERSLPKLTVQGVPKNKINMSLRSYPNLHNQNITEMVNYRTNLRQQT